jgi:hypothetical protein
MQFYAAADLSAAQIEARAQRRARWISNLRLVAIVGMVAAIVLAMRDAESRDVWRVAASIAGSAFIALVVVHSRTTRRLERATARRQACGYGLARMRRDWDALPVPLTVPLDDAQSVLANDLAVTGHASLATLLDVATPGLGGTRVVQWLLSDPAPPETIAARAESVSQLRSRPELLLDVATRALWKRRGLATGIGPFGDWASRVPARDVVMRARLGAGISFVIVALLVAGATQGAVPLVLLALAAHVTLAGFSRSRLERDLRGLDDAFTQSAAVARSLDGATALTGIGGEVGVIARRLHQDNALDAMLALRRLLDWNNTRYSPMGLWMLNAVAGLDAHLWRGIVRWRARHGASAAGWIDAAAVVEAQVALATLGFEHPDWAMPVVHDDLERPPLRATALGHPLIESARCVRNDLVLARGGDLLVVSGSNMSGKTTYLRAAGLNALLAQAGGPVCAASFELRRCRVRTSVRVEDDLASGVSLFYAEARRLRDIVAAAREQDRPPVLFLLDEILHGTNAADRRRATQVVLSHLVRAGAFGMVTTHDPLIAPDAEANVRQVHFSEALSADDDAGLEFDYRIREGPATSANALAILRALGL